MDDVEEGAQAVDLEQLAGQRAGQVEAEAVDVHLEHPVAQAVHDELQDVRVGHVQRVAAAGEVHVVARVGRQAVVGGVVDAAHRERRPHLVALGGVVVDHVEDHLEPRGVHRPDHHLELLHGVLRDAVAAVVRRSGRRSPACCSPSSCSGPSRQVAVVEVSSGPAAARRP